MCRSKPLGRIAAVLLVVTFASSGCLFTAKLDANGGGHLTLRYRLVSVLYFDQHKAGLQSPDVMLKSSVLAPDKWATFDLEFADIRKLPTAPLLANVRIELLDREHGVKTLAVTLDNKAAQPMPDLFQTYMGRMFKVSAELPGAVLESNATATNGRTATWTLPIGNVSQEQVTDFSVSFQPATPKDTTGG